MLFGVISDSHDHLPNLRRALELLREAGAEAVLHCGDLISPFVTRELGRFPGSVHTVFGNNDGDRFLALKAAIKDAPNVTHHGEFGFVELGGRRFGLTHYGEYALGMAASGQCEAAFYGHTHVHKEQRTAAGALALNPGELLGLLGPPSFCVVDSASLAFEHKTFPRQNW